MGSYLSVVQLAPIDNQTEHCQKALQEQHVQHWPPVSYLVAIT